MSSWNIRFFAQCWSGPYWDIHNSRHLSGAGEEGECSQHSKHNQQHQTAEDVGGPDCGMRYSSNHIYTCSAFMYLSISPQAQYVFIHDAILEYLTCGDTQINAVDLRTAIAGLMKQDELSGVTGFQNQFAVSAYASNVTFCHMYTSIDTESGDSKTM